MKIFWPVSAIQHLLLIIGVASLTGCATNRAPSNPATPQNDTSATTQSSQTAESSNTVNTTTKPNRKITKALRVQGHLSDTRLNEVSGLASSILDSNRLWAINDSGNRAELFAINRQAAFSQVWQVAVSNRDWEAMASTSIGGVPYLLIADTGDNLAVHAEYRLHLIEEPDKDTTPNKPLIPAATIRFNYPDGSHNVEAIAVSGLDVYLLTKERLSNKTSVPSRIYRLALQWDNTDAVQTAVLLGLVQMPKRNWKVGLLTRLLNIDPIQPTDLVISADNNHAYVLNYVHVLHYERFANETWPQALAKQPNILHSHGLRQAEALTITADGNVWITSEKAGARLLAFTGVQSSKASRVSP